MGEVKMELRRPTLADKETILNMMTEFEETQSAHDGGFWDAENFDYEEWLDYAGHIGYSIRPSERGKGYAKEALYQGLQLAKEKNIHRALVTCSTENPASRAVILANGGQLEDVRNGTERYWIEVE